MLDKFYNTVVKTINKYGKDLLRSFIAGCIVFCVGFLPMLLLWQRYRASENYSSQLPGFFSYKAAIWGDAICLPLLIFGLCFYLLLFGDKLVHYKRISKYVGIIAGAVGIIIQASWLINSNTKPNWSIPRVHHFNTAGWYHAAFFVFIFAVLGYLFTMFFFAKTQTIMAENEYAGILAQTIIWFSSTWFLAMHNLDDYTATHHFFQVLLITLVLCLFIAFGIVVTACKKGKKQFSKSEIIPIVSGCTSGYALANIIYGSVRIDVSFLISCALLLIVLVTPEQNDMIRMLLMYLIISVPTLLLEASISVQEDSLHMAVVCFIAILTPLIIASGQTDQSGVNVLRKGIMASLIIMIEISLLMATFVLGGRFENSDLFEMLLNLVLVYAIPNYVRSTFSHIIKAEDEDNISQVRGLQGIMYPLYILLFIGAAILILRTAFPKIEGLKLHIDRYQLLCGGIILILIIVYTFLTTRKKEKISGKTVGNLFFLILTTVLYALIFLVLISQCLHLNISLIQIMSIHPVEYILSVPVWIGLPCVIGICFRSNLTLIRGLRPSIWTNIASAIIALMVVTNSFLSETLMIAAHSRVGIWVNGISIACCTFIIPVLTGMALYVSPDVEQVAKNDGIAGVAQDGVLFGMLAFLTELLTVFFIPVFFQTGIDFSGLLGCIVSSLVYVSMLSWPLQYCLKNNIDHFERRKEQNRNSDILLALKKHLCVQNVLSLAIAFPYSLYVIISYVFSFGMSDSNSWKDLKKWFLPGVDYPDQL